MSEQPNKPKKTQPPAESIRSGRPRTSTAAREPRLSQETKTQSVRAGRVPKKTADLTVQRESMSAIPVRDGDENIVRVRGGVDRVMLSLILILLALGSIMVFSASYPSALAERGDSMYYIRRQLLFIALGLTGMTVASIFPPNFYKKISVVAYGVAIVLLILVLIIGTAEGVAKRWIGIPNTPFSFQPSEIMKLALVMMLAWYLDKYRAYVTDRTYKKKYLLYGIVVPLGFIGFACLLILMEKHLSGTLIVGAIGACVLLVGGVHLGWTALMGLGVGGAAVGVFLALNPYALKRITTFTDENADKLDEAWQTTQGLLAIGSGGPLGVGLGASRQKYSYVSAAQNDFIFTIWCEEMGFIGAVVLIMLFLLFIWRGYVIAMRAPDTFSCLLVLGIVSQVGIQAFLNIAVVTSLIPNTGIALPFFSYGGTSLIILMLEMGVVLSVSKHSYQKK